MRRLFFVLIALMLFFTLPSLASLPGGGDIYGGGVVINVTTADTVPHYEDQLNLVLSNATGVNAVGGSYKQGVIYTNGTTRPDWTDTTCTTNIAGACINNNLVANALYNVSGSKTGYGNSTYYPVVAVGV